MNRRRRSIAIAAVLLAAVLAAWWWSSRASGPGGPGVEFAGAGRLPGQSPSVGPRETQRTLERVEVIAAPSGAGEQRSTFSGRVVSQDTGAPVPGATVTFSLGGAYDVLAGAEGAFRFEVPRPGTVRARRIAAAGFLPYDSEPGSSALQLIARPGVSVGGIQLELRPLRRCSGTVTRGERPAAGARVRCSWRGRVVSEAQADGAGAFELGCGTWAELTVEGEDAYQWVEGGGDCRWDVDLERYARHADGGFEGRRLRKVIGRVVDERDQPVERVTVWCNEVDDGELEIVDEVETGGSQPIGQTARSGTDESGAFECEVGADAEVRVRVPGVPSAEKRVPAGVDRVTLVIPVRGRIRGSVRDVDDRPVPAFGIEIESSAGIRGARSFISADGTFEIDDVITGRYEVTAGRPGFPPSAPASVEVRSGSTAEVTLVLRKGLTVRGIVLDAVTHRPIPGARVSPPDPRRLPGPVAVPEIAVTTDGNGRFEISRVLLEGAQSLTISAPGYNDWELGLREAQLEEVTVELTPTAVDAGTEFGGVGMGMDRRLYVTLITPTGPAGRAGVVIGDRIARIDGRSPEDMPDAISHIRGPLGTQVEIQFERADGGVLDTRLRRERIVTP